MKALTQRPSPHEEGWPCGAPHSMASVSFKGAESSWAHAGLSTMGGEREKKHRPGERTGHMKAYDL